MPGGIVFRVDGIHGFHEGSVRGQQECTERVVAAIPGSPRERNGAVQELKVGLAWLGG
jgi:hypothetical protein